MYPYSQMFLSLPPFESVDGALLRLLVTMMPAIPQSMVSDGPGPILRNSLITRWRVKVSISPFPLE
jgi:hypothetical protein